MLASRARLLIVTLWVGSLWTIGCLVAPILFATLPDKALAGTIAGTLFRLEAWLSVFCSVILMALLRARRDNNPKQLKAALVLVAGMLVCTLIGYFALHPFMAALRETAGPAGMMASDAKMQFGILHGISSGMYLIQSLLGVVLLFEIR
jgi:hypothetical protein